MIIIAPIFIKRQLLKSEELNETIKPIKYLTMEQLTEKLTFSYTTKTIFHLTRKYHMKYEVALAYLKNLIFLGNNVTQNFKLLFLQKLKHELDSLHLLEYDQYFCDFIKKEEVVFYGYYNIPSFLLKKIPNYQIKSFERKTREYKVYEFETMEEEVSYVASEISKLISLGIKINNIKIIANSEYFHTINMIFSFFGIPINIPKKIPLFHTNIGKLFFSLLENDIRVTLEKLKNKITNKDIGIYNKIVDICNKYIWHSNFLEIKDLLKYEFMVNYKEEVEYEQAVEIVPLGYLFTDNDYVFALGFNERIYPPIYYNNDFFTDEEKLKIGLETSRSINKKAKNYIINYLSNISNLKITYKLKTPFTKYYPSILISELNMKVINDQSINYHYSHLYNQILLSKYLDDLTKLNYHHPDLNSLYNTYPNIKYQTYDNKFTGIDKSDLANYLKSKLNLSYTAIDKYYKCSFMYYLDNILKLNIYENTFPIFIGNLFHYVLSYAFLENFNFEEKVEEFLKANRNLNAKEKFLLIKLKKELRFAIDTIKKQQQYLDIDNALYEERVVVNFSGDLKVTFTGVIDKIVYKNAEDDGNNCAYIALIDYKTGAINLGLDNIDYGLNLQLPVYIYLAKKKFQKAKVYGFYLQKVLCNEFAKSDKKTLQEQKEEAMRLQGYTLNNSDKFILLNDKSKLIKGLKQKKDGTYHKKAKVVDNDQINFITNLAEEKINQAIKQITNGVFPINPKIIDEENISCVNCKFKDICFVSEKDKIRLEKRKIIGDNRELD